jgi:WW domain-containing oxidoreductase
MSVIEIFKGNGKSGFGYGSTAEQVTKDLSLHGKTILVTGINSGLGYETTRVLSMRGAQVVGTARTLDKAKSALQNMNGKGLPFECELSEPTSVRTCVENLKKEGLKFDAIICNAGIMALPKLKQAHGFELQFFTNHIGHFIFVTGLLSQLKDQGRVVMLSSAAHGMAPKGGIDFENLSGEKSYSDWTAYGQSKMANLLFSKELARRLKGTGKTANAIHPGVIKTNLGRHMNPIARTLFGAVGPLFLKSPEQGAATQVYAAVHPSVAEVSGAYFADCNVKAPRSDAENPELARRLWEKSEEIVARL